MDMNKYNNILTYELLNDLYTNKLMTIDEIGEYLKIGHTTISKYIDNFGIIKMTPQERNIKKLANICFSESEISVIRGALLGDGTITKFNNMGMFSYSSTSFEHVAYVKSYLDNFVLSDVAIKKPKNKNNIYCFTTKRLPQLKTEADLWYENYKRYNCKRNIPNDLILNPLMCLIWYIGDGGIRTRRKNNSQILSLATNNFKKECIEDILIPQLKDFEARLESTSNEGQYLITIPKRKMQGFLDYIGECPFEDYQHKWNVIPYKRNRYIDENLIKEMYDRELTYTQMASLSGYGKTTLVRYIKKLRTNNIIV